MRALDEATKSTCRYQLGAYLVSGKKVLAYGHNRWMGLDKVLTRYGMLWSLHAEMDALRKAPFGSSKGATLYVARINGKLAMPCSKCMDVLNKAGVARVVYTTGSDDTTIGKISL